MDHHTIAVATAEVEGLLSKKIPARGRDLTVKLTKTRHRLPRAIRTDALFLAETEVRLRNPKRAGQVDVGRVRAAKQRCLEYLRQVDPGQRRSWNFTVWLTCFCVNLLLFALACYLLLQWIG